MLAYLATKDQFLLDAPTIEDKVKNEVKRKLGHNVGDSEYASWRNSLGNAMYHAMNTADIPGDAGEAIYLIRLADVLDIDVASVVRKKLAINESRF